MAVEEDWLTRSINGSYFSMRVAIAAIGLALPLVLLIGGALTGCAVQTSLSAYFHTPVRDLFVGMLFLIAAPLHLYHGYSRRENLALNIAAVGAVMVALFPTGLPDTGACLTDAARDPAPVLHIIGAFAFFLGGAFVAIVCAPETLDRLPEESAARYRMTYRSLGSIMVLTPISALAITLLVRVQPYYVLVVEILGVATLAVFWLVKTQEIRTILARQPQAHMA